MSLEGYKDFSFDYGGISHTVYHKGDGPGVVLMHELPGLTKDCIALGDRLVEKDYRVYMPLLFGKPGERSLFGGFFRVCISREFRVLATKQTSPIVEWLKGLSRQVWEECGGPGVGVIGMCLTGNFAISLMANKEVLAPVSCQPSLPILSITKSQKGALALSNEDLKEIKEQAANGKKLLGFRFTNDTFCHHEKFVRLKKELGDSFDGTEIDSSWGNEHGISLFAHSVLTYNFNGKDGHPTKDALNKVLGFFENELKSDA